MSSSRSAPACGVLEVTAVNRHRLGRGRLGRTALSGYWADAGTPGPLAPAGQARLRPAAALVTGGRLSPPPTSAP